MATGLLIGATAAVSSVTLGGQAARAAWQHAGGWSQGGQASYYGRHWNGRRTSSGAVFDPTKLTAAHASLPLGTRLLVTCENSGESVVVTVNDREPAHGRRIIDLSPEAARRLGMLDRGVADVVITEASPTDIGDKPSETEEEVADAPDEADDQDVAVPRSVHHLSHVRRGPPRRHLAHQ